MRAWTATPLLAVTSALAAPASDARLVFDDSAPCSRSRAARRHNIDDGIQSLVSVQHSDGILATVERDRAVVASGGTLWMNGRWDTLPSAPPPRAVSALPVGMYLSRQAASTLRAAWLDWFRRQEGGVGMRDTTSLEGARAAGVGNAYFSGCPTSIRRPTRARAPNGTVLVVDVNRVDTHLIPPSILRRARFATQDVQDCEGDVIRSAADRLVELAEASLVVTTRLHVAIPCLAIGTPVVFIDRHLAGGGGRQSGGALEVFCHARRCGRRRLGERGGGCRTLPTSRR